MGEEGVEEQVQVLSQVSNRRISVKRIAVNNKKWRTVKTGPLRCRQSFEAIARLKVAAPGGSTWWGEYIALVHSGILLGVVDSTLRSLWMKEDPGTWAYGVHPGDEDSKYSSNLKTKLNKKAGYLPMNVPVTITYNKEDRTVRFSSSYFELY